MEKRAPSLSLILALLGILQGWQLYVLSDLRARVVRIEDRYFLAGGPHG